MIMGMMFKNVEIYGLINGTYKFLKKAKISRKHCNLDLTEVFAGHEDLNNVKLVMKYHINDRLDGERLGLKIDNLEFSREITRDQEDYIVVKRRTNKPLEIIERIKSRQSDKKLIEEKLRNEAKK